MKQIALIFLFLSSCFVDSNKERIIIYKIEIIKNIITKPKLVKTTNDNDIMRKMLTLKLENKIKVKIVPRYIVEILEHNIIYKVSENIVSVNGESYQLQENIQQYISDRVE